VPARPSLAGAARRAPPRRDRRDPRVRGGLALGPDAPRRDDGEDLRRPGRRPPARLSRAAAVGTRGPARAVARRPRARLRAARRGAAPGPLRARPEPRLPPRRAPLPLALAANGANL